jgi:[ribosomal protein S5]-alanine N-acetyltransferase
VFELQLVGLEHEAAILAFEKSNRDYFARSINDRGDSFFERFPDEHRELLTEQAVGTGAFYVLVDERDDVVGRFNLYDISDGTASVGYRLAERIAGRGVATGAVQALCRIARDKLGLVTLTAATSIENVASQRVLLKSGFIYVAPTEVGGRPGSSFKIDFVTL